MFERLFRLSEFGTDIRTEIIAGMTTFLTMSYIIVVNPGILEAAGIPVGPSMVATIIASAVGCMIMGLYANRPIAIAPYMGENAFIAFTVVLALGYSWQAGITAVLIGGILFVIITAVRLRSWLAASIPTNLKYAFAVAIGLFLTFIGLMTTGIVENSTQGVPTKVGQLTSPQVLLALFSFIFIVALMIRKVRGAIIVGMIVTTAIAYLGKGLGWQLPDVMIPDRIVSTPPSLAPIAFQFRFAEVLTIGFLPILLTVFLMDFVDTMGTLIGVSARAGFLDDEGNLPDIEKPMMADAVATIVGACCGTTTTGSYLESAAGIEEGGRTGLTALVAGLLFLLALFFTPILTAIPKCAYGPALIIVGILMIDSVKRMDFSDLTELVPAFGSIVLMSFTYNLGVGFTAGFVLYPVVKLVAGRAHEVRLGTWILGGLCLVFYIFYPYH